MAIDQLSHRPWHRPDPCRVFSRLADDRLLISREDLRTTLRQIARECGLSCGRTVACERLLIDTVEQCFTRDPQLPLLLEFAREDPLGLDGTVFAHRRDLLDRAELEAFHRRFANLDRPDRAEIVLAMIERSAASFDEVVRNLYRLTAREDGPLAVPA